MVNSIKLQQSMTLDCSPPLSLLMLSNSTALLNWYKTMANKWDHMFWKRSFEYWFVGSSPCCYCRAEYSKIGEGMEGGEFSEAREDCELLIEKYHEIQGEQ